MTSVSQALSRAQAMMHQSTTRDASFFITDQFCLSPSSISDALCFFICRGLPPPFGSPRYFVDILSAVGYDELAHIMPPKRTKSSVATPAKKHTRRVKSSQDSAVVVEQIIHKVSDEVTRRLSSTSEKRSANDSQILDRGSDMLVGGVGAGAEQVSEVSALGIPTDSPGESMIEGAVSQFQDRLSGVYTSQFPSEAPALMKYGEIVQDLASRGHDWHYYGSVLQTIGPCSHGQASYGDPPTSSAPELAAIVTTLMRSLAYNHPPFQLTREHGTYFIVLIV
ncbi:uncharacterized protein [Acropora muricata]|uniref:uncharacterized protein isoform X6 n=1 Tax=Acropora muricata TaxID=159855 RepID=UPI0034E5207E